MNGLLTQKSISFQQSQQRSVLFKSRRLIVGSLASLAVFFSTHSAGQQQYYSQHSPQRVDSVQHSGFPPSAIVQARPNAGFVRPAASGYFQSAQPARAIRSTVQLRSDMQSAMQAQQWPAAIAAVQALRVRETQPLRIAYWLHVEAVLLTRQQSWQLAEQQLREALRLSNSNRQRKYLVAEALSVVLMRQNRWADAASLLRDVKPNNDEGLLRRWQLLRGLAGYQSGDYVEAAGLYGQLMQNYPRDAAATVGFARTLEQLKRYQVAMLSYRRVVNSSDAALVLRRYALKRLQKIIGSG